MAKPNIKSDGRTITVRVPISIRKRGGKKVILAPEASTIIGPVSPRSVDNALVKAIARAFRWREMLDRSTHSTIAEIALAERISEVYVGRILRLTSLAPDIIELILTGRQPSGMTLAALMERFPVIWPHQREVFKVPS